MDLQLQKPLENLHMAFNTMDMLVTDLNAGTQDSPLDKLCPKDLSKFYLQLLLVVCRLFQLA